MLTCLNAGLLSDTRLSKASCVQAQHTAQRVYRCTAVEAWAHVTVLALSRVQASASSSVSKQTQCVLRGIIKRPNLMEFDRLKWATGVLYRSKLCLDCYCLSAICVYIIFGYCSEMEASVPVSPFQRMFQVHFGEFDVKPLLIDAFGSNRCFWTCHVSYSMVITMTATGILVLGAAQMAQWIVQNTQRIKQKIESASGLYMELLKTYLSILEDETALRVIYYDETGGASIDVCVC